MFLDNSNYLKKHSHEFGMIITDVGYKEKLEIINDPTYINYKRQELFENLMKIIYFKNNTIDYEVQCYKKRK